MVLLDNTPSEQWRVSSPLSSSSIALATSSQAEIPVLMIREADWRRADTQVFFFLMDSKICYISKSVIGGHTTHLRVTKPCDSQAIESFQFPSQLVQLSQAGTSAREQKSVFLTWNDPSTISLAPLFSCTSSPILRTPGVQNNQECSGGKTLHRNGSLQEEVQTISFFFLF